MLIPLQTLPALTIQVPVRVGAMPDLRQVTCRSVHYGYFGKCTELEEEGESRQFRRVVDWIVKSLYSPSLTIMLANRVNTHAHY
jgi:hypothetical protein